MKTSKKCLSCGGEEIYETDGQFLGDADKAIPNAKLPLSVSSGVKTYICGSCGYVAFYLKPENLRLVKGKYRRV
ncbi:hypothetical protein B1R32_13014 [Abditibacterium utsteinense]|uniref:Uncharacterized protein n=1 Tax=Abditibacterium utsteinense TaxID=1960156 RepID=A0A2S8SP08_9BACT|nr:hypothetical protein [Abditibacterium utsteinense]PQV62527.1 hypothetical protein B1R32_13014 [Abditibacterium utsteinense]